MRLPRSAGVPALLTGLVLLEVSGRYGYHRDELYFLEAGKHLAWGYPDQPPLTPLLARVFGHSLWLLRLPSTISAAVVVLLAGLMSRELGGSTRAQWIASGSTALCGFVLATGHLLATATTGILGCTAVTYLVLRLLHGSDRRLWPVVGLVAGISLQANVFPAFLLAALGLSFLLVGPRELLRQPGPWVAGLIASAAITPYLLWQAQHGWPQLAVARGIAAGNSGSSVSRPLFVPFLLLQIGPWLLPIWFAGLRRLLRDPVLRCLGTAFLLMIVVFVIAGGKPYYVGGVVPLLLAAGASSFERRGWLLVLLSAPALVFTLPLLPVRHAGIAVAVNADTGETIGWPQFVQQIAVARPAGAVILTDNYGEAGAVDHYGQRPAYSGHNGYGLWGPPPGSVQVLAVGIDSRLLAASCSELHQVGTLKNAYGIDDDENGTVLEVCTPNAPWAQLWPRFVHVG